MGLERGWMGSSVEHSHSFFVITLQRPQTRKNIFLEGSRFIENKHLIRALRHILFFEAVHSNLWSKCLIRENFSGGLIRA